MVLGADENGLGPKLGPLVVTGVVLEGGNLPSEVLVDSKRVFNRSVRGYARGEALALRLVEEALGFLPETSRELAEALGLDVDLGGRELPVWAEAPYEGRLGAHWLKVRTFSPKEVNSGNKFSLVVRAFFEFLNEAPWEEAVLGKVGSRVRYGLPGKLVESKDKSVYLWRGRKVGFYRDAERFSAVAAASLVGKYVRELAMLRLNELLGYEGEIPWCSGYPGDRNTARALAKLKRLGLWEEWVRLR